MKTAFIVSSFALILACGNMSVNKIDKPCFVVETFPEFKVGGTIDTDKIVEFVQPISTEKEESEIKRASTAFRCLGFDQGINDLKVYRDKETNKINWIDAGWNYLQKTPEYVLDTIHKRYLPCLPVEQLLANPDELITFGSDDIIETYRYGINEYGMVTVRYSAHIRSLPKQKP